MSQENTNSSVKWRVRPMEVADIDHCLEIWRKVELTEAKQTTVSALASDPGGFYVAELEATGEIIGMCAGPITRSDTVFMGFYAVDPKYQKLGVGRELWAKTTGRLDAATNIGLYGVPAMAEKYKKAGFVVEDSIRMLIYSYESNNECQLKLEQLTDIKDLSGCRLELIDGSSDEPLFRKLVDYDQSVQRFSREQLLKLYLRGDDVPLTFAVIKDLSRTQQQQMSDQHQAYGGERKSSCCARPAQESIMEDVALSTGIKDSLSISVGNLGELPARSSSPVNIPSVGGSPQRGEVQTSLTSSYEIIGYGCIRDDNRSGGMIGPIYADSGDICEVILKNLISRFSQNPEKKLLVMALSSNTRACKILTKIGLIEEDQCSRMFTKFVPNATMSKIYYVHSPNFTLF